MPTRLEPSAEIGHSAALKSSCAVCGSGRLDKVIDLPGFPLTGIYTEEPCPARARRFDQALNHCADCGHAQLSRVVDPAYLYVDTYSHRSSASSIARQGNDFFADFLRRAAGGRTFEAALEVGCNDLYLFDKLEALCGRYLGIDPIWKGQSPPARRKLSVIGKFIEEVGLEEEVPVRPDLVISAHTLEHLGDPRASLEAVMRFAAPGALFVIEVPCFDTLLGTLRFDQVFHQHVQYFSLASLQRLVHGVGGFYLSHSFNPDYWGGTLLLAFGKPGRVSTKEASPEARISAPSAVDIRRKFQAFQARMTVFLEGIRRFKGPLYGFGAAQMLPALAYHLGSDLDFLECIFDDDPRKHGWAYPDLKPRIQRPAAGLDLADAGVVITALDSTPQILKRLSSMNVKKVFDPSGFLKEGVS